MSQREELPRLGLEQGGKRAKQHRQRLAEKAAREARRKTQEKTVDKLKKKYKFLKLFDVLDEINRSMTGRKK